MQSFIYSPGTFNKRCIPLPIKMSVPCASTLCVKSKAVSVAWCQRLPSRPRSSTSSPCSPCSRRLLCGRTEYVVSLQAGRDSCGRSSKLEREHCFCLMCLIFYSIVCAGMSSLFSVFYWSPEWGFDVSYLPCWASTGVDIAKLGRIPPSQHFLLIYAVAHCTFGGIARLPCVNAGGRWNWAAGR